MARMKRTVKVLPTIWEVNDKLWNIIEHLNIPIGRTVTRMPTSSSTPKRRMKNCSSRSARRILPTSPSRTRAA